jgi:hypothetical protein
MLIRAPEALKNEVTDEAKRIGISTNALMLQILDEWRRKKNERGGAGNDLPENSKCN